MQQMPKFFDRYIHLVEDIDLIETMVKHQSCPIDIATLELVGDFKHAPEKWTVKDILQHVIDTERIMAYRA